MVHKIGCLYGKQKGEVKTDTAEIHLIKHYLMTYKKINLKWIIDLNIKGRIDLNIKGRTIKFLE